MNLTIIIPILNNKELIRNINKQKKEKDEVITMRITSNNVLGVMQNNIKNAKYDNILLINPRDNEILKSYLVNGFRLKGTVANNLNKKYQITHGSSIKFNRNEVHLQNDTKLNNIFDFIDFIHKYSKAETIGIFPLNVETEKDVIMKQNKNFGTRQLTKNKPKILFICDVKGWAWWIKSHYIKTYLQNDFDIDIISVVDSNEKINPSKYDLYFTYGYSYVNYLNKVPFKKTITGVTAHRNKRKIAPELKKAFALHANSMLLYNEFKDINSNIFYVPNGVDHEMFFPKKESEILQRDFINIGHVGKKSEWKQQETIIEPVIKKLGQGFKYIYHYNNYMNKVPHTEMHELYNDMDLFIVASLEDGTPNGALEAMASGIPVISNRIGNMPEIIQNGYNGYLIDGPTKIENYVKLIKNLDKEHLIEMGKNARQSILNGWTWEHQAQNYKNMFWKLLGR